MAIYPSIAAAPTLVPFQLREGDEEIIKLADGRVVTTASYAGHGAAAGAAAAAAASSIAGQPSMGGQPMVQEFYGDQQMALPPLQSGVTGSPNIGPIGGISQTIGQQSPAAIGPGIAVIGAGLLALRLGGAAILRQILVLIARLTGITIFRGTMTIAWATWSRLPGWARTALIALGAIEGADFILDLGSDVIDVAGDIAGAVVPFIGGGDLIAGLPDELEPSLLAALGIPTPGAPGMGAIVKVWNTVPQSPNLGTWFVRLADGRGAARKKDGTWRIFRYRKPIVIFAGGGLDDNAIRADRALNAKAKRTAKAMRNRGYNVSRQSKKAQ